MGQDTVLATVKKFRKTLWNPFNISVEKLILFGSHAGRLGLQRIVILTWLSFLQVFQARVTGNV